jgi:hypothetical protein
MRLLTLVAVAALAAGIYHYRLRRGLAPGRARVHDAPGRRIEKAVRAAIARAASSPVAVRCVNSVVTLRGTVSVAERDRVLAAALAIPGVDQVTNFLETSEPVGDLGPMQSGIATGV